MKSNKKIIFLPLIAMCLLLAIPLSCKKGFLNQTDTFAATAQASFQKSQDVVDLVNAIYDTYQSSDLLKKSMWYYSNFLTHDWFNNGADIVWNYYGIGSDFGALPTFWNNAYIGIARANAALEVIAASEANGVVTKALGERLKGEAYFLRGMTYYYLAGTFGGVPLELKAETNGLTPRSSQDASFMQVVADMKLAESLLPSKTQYAASDLGRATSGAAYGFEGAAQMWLKNYTAALADFNNTELTTNYHLMPTFLSVGEYTNQNNVESLFEVQFEISGSQSWDGGWQDGGEEAWIDDFSWPQEISGFGYDYGNPGLEYSYQDGDLRKHATIIGPADTIISPGILAKWGGIKGYAVVQSNFTEASIPITATTSAADVATITLARKTYTDATGSINSGPNTSGIINSCGSLKYPWYGTDNTPRSGYYCAKKWRDPTLTGANGTSAIFGGQNQILLRYAEIILDRAECEVRLGQTGPAMADLALVRNRAFGGTAPSVMKDGLNYDGTASSPITDPMQMVLSEYRHELTGEYSLMYDLRRAGVDAATGKNYDAEFIHNAYGTVDGNTNQIIYPYGPTADGKTHGVWNTSLPVNKDLLPLPVSAIALNPNLTQNPSF